MYIQNVLDAAGIDWNFIKYKPAHVGRYCVSADYWLLADKIENLSYHLEVILVIGLKTI
jgi:hypothetical protein